MFLQETTITKNKSINNLQEVDSLPRVDSSSRLSSLPRVDSSSKLSSIPKVPSLPRIKSVSELLCQEDEVTLIENQTSSGNELTLLDFNISINTRKTFFCQDESSESESEIELRKSMLILPSQYNQRVETSNLNYFELIKDHIRNNRKLSEKHLKYIKQHLNCDQKMEIIKLYSDCCAVLVYVLEKHN